jgi:hypothetical protein
MTKSWVLDTDTKGTGAEMVPLEKLLERKRARPDAPATARRRPGKPAERPAKPEQPRQPRRFKVVDVMTREVVAEDADARATVEALRGFRSMVDVNVSVWDREAHGYRLLTLGEQTRLWRLRHAAAAGS